MTLRRWIEDILQRFGKGEIRLDYAISELLKLPYEDIGIAKLDHHREIRKGIPEVIFGQDKTQEDLLRIAEGMLAKSHRFIATRLSREQIETLRQKFPQGKAYKSANIFWVSDKIELSGGTIAIITAGTSDYPVAEEALATLEFLGNPTKKILDVGVAGIHRLLSEIDDIRESAVAIVIAGMEGALPSVVAGLVDIPVIGVPTSVGYGASFSGISPLLTMLNSCSNGIAVVNIDNGFGAGYFAHLIARRT